VSNPEGALHRWNALKQAIDLPHVLGRKWAEIKRFDIICDLRKRSEAGEGYIPIAARPNPRYRSLRERSAVTGQNVSYPVELIE
jgi:hypothetical protein